FSACFGDHHQILDSGQNRSLDDLRFDGEHHSVLEDSRKTFVEEGVLVDVHPDAMARSIRMVLSKPGFLDDAEAQEMQLLSSDGVSLHGGDGRLFRLDNSVVSGEEFLGRLAEVHDAAKV